jgi:NAD(P)-dependent dehydrogenase (short-subunit alcohol dehydrogenase family)
MNLTELTHLYDFSGKTAVITGGTGVLGGEMACALVGCGANVAVLDRNPNLPDELKLPMDAGPGKYMVVYADVLDRALLEGAVTTVRGAFGEADILINAAGGNHPQACLGTPWSSCSTSTWSGPSSLARYSGGKWPDGGRAPS